MKARTPFNKMMVLGALLVVPLGGHLQAQVFTPPSGQGGAPAGGGNNTTIVNQQQPQSNRQVVGNDVPFFDPKSETFFFDGKTWNITDNRVFRARFEKYLNMPESSSEEDKAYRTVMRGILDELSPHRKPDLPSAVALLQNASGFEQDARLCESISNAVYRVWLARKSVREMEQMNVALEERRRKLDWNFDKLSEPSALSKGPQKIGAQNQGGGNGQAPANGVNATTQTTAEAGHVSRYVQRIAEVEAERVANKAKMELSEVQAKLEFQALVVQLFGQRRFEHVIIAARMYTEFFHDGQGRLEFKDGSDVSKVFGQSIGFDPTITSLDTAANGFIREVDEAVKAFGFLIEKGEIDGAMRQLQHAFLIGEYMPSVQMVPLKDKQKILTYARDSFQLLSTMEIRDFTLAEELVTRMRQTASDFDYSKPMQAIETAKITSNMRIRTAKNAALKGEMAAYEENIKAATEIWPTNPQLKEQFELIADSGDMQLQVRNEFDRLLSTQSYRQIFNDKGRFLAAVHEDPERKAALEQIMTNIQEIEIAMQQAEALGRGGNKFAAWEIIDRTFKKFPDDVPLSAKRSDLSTEVAEFVRALKSAEDLEKRNPGSSLAWYLRSRKIYPKSEFAQQGIDRLKNALLPDSSASLSNAPSGLSETPPAPGDPVPGDPVPGVPPSNF